MIINGDWVVAGLASLLAGLLVAGCFVAGSNWHESEADLAVYRQHVASRQQQFEAFTQSVQALPDLSRKEQAVAARWSAAMHGQAMAPTALAGLDDDFQSAVDRAARHAGLRVMRAALFVNHAQDEADPKFKEYQVVLAGRYAGMSDFAHTVAVWGLGMVAQVRTMNWDARQGRSTWVIRVMQVPSLPVESP